MALGDIKTFDIVYAGLTLRVNAIDLGGTTTFEVKCLSGSADVNALYWNDGDATAGEGSLIGFGAKSDNSLNMNGTAEAWDGGVKLSSAGIGKEGAAKATYLQTGESYAAVGVAVSWSTITHLGVRATTTSTAEGSIKGVDTDGPVTTFPKVCVEDAAPVVEGNNAAFQIHLDHAYAYDVTVNYTTVGGTAGDGTDYVHKAGSVVIAAGQTSVVVNVATTDDNFVESTENFTLHINSATADIPGPDLAVTILCNDGLGTILDNDTLPPPPPGNDPPSSPSDAGSPGYWKNHDGSGAQANDWDIAQNTSFETYFSVAGPYGGSWDVSSPVNGSAGLQTDITFRQALDLPNGGGGENLLAKEATVAVLNFLDSDFHDDFVAWYVYERNLNDNDANPLNNPVDDATDANVLADLKAQIDATLSGAPGAYSIASLTNLLIPTHEA